MDKNMKYILKVFNNYEEMSENAAQFITEITGKEIGKRGYFTLVLSGGKTPKKLYSLLAKKNIDWNRTMLFWGDERFVPHDHPESNYNMARENLIDNISIPDKNIFPIPTDSLTPEKSAKSYELTLQSFFKSVNNIEFSFDCILLGIGSDGHTASLFPNNPVLNEKKHWVKDTIAPEGYSIRQRITLTLPIINRANCILFLVSGDEKRVVIETMINRKSEKPIYPAQIVKAIGNTYIFTDIKL